eukprot:SM005784S18745  [mRNA]  locus=s5784:70:909:+ [translate_table: standard]
MEAAALPTAGSPDTGSTVAAEAGVGDASGEAVEEAGGSATTAATAMELADVVTGPSAGRSAASTAANHPNGQDAKLPRPALAPSAAETLGALAAIAELEREEATAAVTPAALRSGRAAMAHNAAGPKPSQPTAEDVHVQAMEVDGLPETVEAPGTSTAPALAAAATAAAATAKPSAPAVAAAAPPVAAGKGRAMLLLREVSGRRLAKGRERGPGAAAATAASAAAATAVTAKNAKSRSVRERDANVTDAAAGPREERGRSDRGKQKAAVHEGVVGGAGGG